MYHTQGQRKIVVVTLSIFTSCAVFRRARRGIQNTNEYSQRYYTLNRQSNKLFIIQLFFALNF